MLRLQGAVSNKSLHILLVSDHPDDPIQALDALSPTFPNLEVRQVRDEQGLADAVTRGDFNLAMIDAHLTWTESLSVMQTIRLRFSNCPILMIVSESSEPVIQKALQFGLDGYVSRLSQQLMNLPVAIWLVLEKTRGAETWGEHNQLLDSVPIGLFRITASGKIQDVNLAFTRILGYPDRESLLAVNLFDLCVNPKERERLKALYPTAKDFQSFETQFYRHNGTIIWVEQNVRLVEHVLQPQSFYEGTLIDITHRKQTEFSLKESEECFRTIVEQSPISIQIMTRKGWIIKVNQAWEKLWGVTAADLKKYNILEDEQIIDLGMMPYVRRGFTGEAMLLPPVSYHTPESLKNGRKRWFQARIYPVMGKQNEIRNVIMLYEDITELQWATEDLHRLSKELMNTQEAERKQISQELHEELGQALTAMKINLDMLEKGLPMDLADGYRERLAEIHMLVDETLDHTRELAHTLRPNMLDDLGLIPTLRWYVNRYADRMGIELEFEVKDLEERLAAEIETTLYRVIREALTNIARHAQARRVYLHLVRRGNRVSALIEDDGLGFAVQQRSAVETSGSGMGLYWMRERVELCGGTFTIQSQPGKGTRLFLELPLSQSLASEDT